MAWDRSWDGQGINIMPQLQYRLQRHKKEAERQSVCKVSKVNVDLRTAVTDCLRSANKFPVILQLLIGLKIHLYATPSPTTSDCGSYFIV